MPPEFGDMRPMFRMLLDNLPEAWHREQEIFTRSGERRLIRWNNSVLRSGTGEVIGTASIGEDITARKQAEEALQSSLREKEALLKEVHHRVKNNLQVITSLLRLESGRSTHADTKSVLVDMQGRIRSMALLHESLYRSGTFASVDLGVYLKQLVTQAFRALDAQSGAIHLHLELASVRVAMDQATPCGLLVNELVSNCLKHGFADGRGGEVRVVLQELDGNQLRLSVSDNGVGLPDDFTLRRENSLGLQLVADLTRQIGGILQVATDRIAMFVVTFTIDAAHLRESRE
jgi:two-component sensor histidine kinase